MRKQKPNFDEDDEKSSLLKPSSRHANLYIYNWVMKRFLVVWLLIFTEMAAVPVEIPTRARSGSQAFLQAVSYSDSLLKF